MKFGTYIQKSGQKTPPKNIKFIVCTQDRPYASTKQDCPKSTF